MPDANPFVKQYLMTAGPTPLPPRVSQVMAEPVLYHRAPAGVELYTRVLQRLPAVFRTENDVQLFSSSGSGAMESAVANLVRPGDRVLACAAGKFGERWIELGEAYGADVVRYEPGWGARLDPAEVERLLGENPEVNVVLRHAVRDLHRRRARRPRAGPGRAGARRVPRRRRHLRPRRGRRAPGRVGHRRGRRRLAEGADVPARHGLRLRLPARARLRHRAPRAAATTSTGPAPSAPSARIRRTRPSPRR